MHTDARTLPGGSVLEGDLCIVGAGPAGISMALDWIGSSRTVLLLEGGGFEHDPAMQDLHRGENVGLPYYPLEAARLHYFGGTTGHWAGFCSPYDPIDFEKRDWVPHSGWPITREELDPFYRRAQRVLELGPYEYEASDWQRRDAALLPLALNPRAMWTKMWQFSPPTRFGARYRDAIVNARNVHLYTYANVCEVEANEPLTAVSALRVRTLDGREYTVRARHYVLACCSIQNARLLLASNSRAPAGLGNSHDLVGRYFMEHLEMPGGHLALAPSHAATMKMYGLDFGRTKARGELALTAAVQRERRILNGTVSLEPGDITQTAPSTFQWATPEVVAWFREFTGSTEELPPPPGLPEGPPAGTPRRFFHLGTRQEQAPNPSSRVTLSTERDALGVPRVKLDWRLTQLDRRSFRALYEAMATEFGRDGAGRVRILDWVLAHDTGWPELLSGGWHHMGTTRMHRDPRQGVVDANCRVHGIGNLYVAGASAFPTAGAANPTLTLVALSLRLSDHLKTTLA
jgi:choline dehydrogenase-like flavoprotein